MTKCTINQTFITKLENFLSVFDEKIENKKKISKNITAIIQLITKIWLKKVMDNNGN